MIAGWIVYCLVISALIAIVAAGLDELLTSRGRPARWIWLAAIGASLAIPATALILQQRPPTPIAGAGDVRVGTIFDRVRERQLLRQRPTPLVERLPRLRVQQWLAADRFVTAAVIACILLASVRVAVDSVKLFRGRRRWRADLLDGERVLVSTRTGPALVGLLHATIVVPEWVASLPDYERLLMLAHEREHRRAGDGLLAMTALFGALCMPWNPAMWWMFRRLRTAIEVDCDRRVLGTFPDVERYGRLLMSVAERSRGESSFAITGFSERAGSLARRIRAMTTRLDARRHQRRSTAMLARTALSTAAAIGTFVIVPPLPAARVAESQPIALLLPKSVADSIATDSVTEATAGIAVRHRIVDAARDLPAAFIIDDPGPANERLPLAGRCPVRLHDPRNATRLQLRVSSGSTGTVVQRGDTAWTRITRVGLYRVSLPGAYGVGAGQLLRVGCGSATKLTLANHVAPSTALSDLESQKDDRARRIAAAVSAAIRRRPEEVELYPGRLNVAISDDDADWTKRDSDDHWAMTRRVWETARDVLGRAAMPETLAFSVRLQSGTGVTLVYYSSQSH
jgi:hypothetical protein